jgi:hypothetical protein
MSYITQSEGVAETGKTKLNTLFASLDVSSDFAPLLSMMLGQAGFPRHTIVYGSASVAMNSTFCKKFVCAQKSGVHILILLH